MNYVRAITAVIVLSTSAHAADPENADGSRQTECLIPCAPGQDLCGPDDVDEFPDFDGAVSEILANCQAPRPSSGVYAVLSCCKSASRLL